MHLAVVNPEPVSWVHLGFCTSQNHPYAVCALLLCLQAATAAALLQRYTAAAAANNVPRGYNQSTPASAVGGWAGTPPTGPAGPGTNPFLAPGGPTQAGSFGGPAAAAGGPLGTIQHSMSSMGGFDSSQHSSAANNVQQSGSAISDVGAGVSGSGFGLMPGGLNSPEAIYGTDGLDVPGTAQVGAALVLLHLK